MRPFAPIRNLVLAAFATLAFGGTAHAQSLSAGESARLSRGETIVRETTWERGERRYIGGLTYTVLDASVGEVAAVFDDVTAYRRVLPRTKRARLVESVAQDKLIELSSGNDLMEAVYTIRVRRTQANEFRFWLEPSLPHGIDDAWGYFRLTHFPGSNGENKVLLTYGILVDVGPGIVRQFFEDRVRGAVMSVPHLLGREVTEARHARASR